MSGRPPTVDGVVAEARRRLRAAGIEEPALHARALAGAVLGLDGAGLIREGDRAADAAAAERILALAARRIAGEPLGRILGRRDFDGLEFALGPDTLEPRPDTEALVEAASAAIRSRTVPRADGSAGGADGAGVVFADVGTGTGAIAVALAVRFPVLTGIATDISAGALAVAKANAARHGVAERLDFRAGSWLEPVAERVGLVVSNPPYIPSGDIAGLDREVREHDPRLALDGGADGLDAYRALVPAAAERLVPGGTLAVEIGWDQGPAVGSLFAAAGFVDVRVLPDLAGRDRVVIGRTAPAGDGARP